MSSKTGGLLYQDAHLTVDAENASVSLNGRLLPLTRKELQLLIMLVRYAGQIVPREKLLASVWEYQAGVKSRTLDVHVRRLRQHMGAFANTYIETIFGKGYRFQPRSERHEPFNTPESVPPRFSMSRQAVPIVV